MPMRRRSAGDSIDVVRGSQPGFLFHDDLLWPAASAGLGLGGEERIVLLLCRREAMFSIGRRPIRAQSFLAKVEVTRRQHVRRRIQVNVSGNDGLVARVAAFPRFSRSATSRSLARSFSWHTATPRENDPVGNKRARAAPPDWLLFETFSRTDRACFFNGSVLRRGDNCRVCRIRVGEIPYVGRGRAPDDR
jgi:hypothetical protein